MSTVDAPGTCHLVGCEGKGQHPPHGIGAPKDFSPYQADYCLGYPVVGIDCGAIDAACSIGGVQAWWVHPDFSIDPAGMAQLVDQHKAECTNRRAGR